MPTGNEVEVTFCLTDGTKLTRIENIADITTFLEQHEEYVKVVRCKDCKHSGYQYRDFHGAEKVVCWKDGYGIRKNANGYCDDGDFRDEKDVEQNG